MILQEDVDFLEHYGVKGMKWGVRRDRRAERLASRSSDEKSKSRKTIAKRALMVGGAGIVIGGAIFMAQRNTNMRNINKSSTKRGAKVSSQQIKSSVGKTKMETVQHAQRAYIKQRHLQQMKTNPEFALMTPEKLLARHNKSKAEFDKWLTLKERDLGYLYKGPK